MKNILENPEEVKFTSIYRAYVVDDEDPRDIGRVRVRVPGVYLETVPTEHLPWAIPATGVYRSGGRNVNPENGVGLGSNDLKTAFNKTGTGGTFVVPARGNHVWIWFDQGNHMFPVYFASQPNEDDWLQQKSYIKEKITTKLQQIKTLASKFTPENGTDGIFATDWAKDGYVNSRQGLTTGGEGLTVDNENNFGNSLIAGSGLSTVPLNISNKDTQGKDSKNMTEVVERAQGTIMTMDVRPLFDKEEGDRQKKEEGKKEKGGDTEKNINRYVYSFTTLGGTTIVIDNREGQENYYLIHKNYMENLDQNGSRKVFIGRNDPVNPNDEVDSKIRSTDELAVDGDKKIHVLGDFVTYVKGNIFTQCDRNMQIDINDSCGLRIKKGDFDIIINGDKQSNRDENSERDEGKSSQQGDLNIDVQKGKLELHVKKSANIHVEGQCNLKVDSDIKMTTKKDFHLHVGGSYHEYIKKNKFSTVGGRKETYVSKDEKRFVDGNVKEEFTGNYDQIIGKGAEYKIIGKKSEDVRGNVNIKANSFVIGANIFGTTADISTFNGEIDAGGTVRIKGDISAMGDLKIGGNGFGQDFKTPTTGLVLHVHNLGTPDATSPPSPPVGMGISLPNPPGTISSSIDSPETAYNNGGGSVSPLFYDADKAKTVSETNPEKNQTVTAERNK